MARSSSRVKHSSASHCTHSTRTNANQLITTAESRWCARWSRGTASVPGATDGNATVDSRERFYSAILAGYGIAWVQATRKSPIRAGDVRLLAGVMLAGDVGRLISLVRNG
jgi:Domain of unknown function (DUF4345)